MSVYQFEVKNIMGEKEGLNKFEGNVLLIVNTASKCGYTPQYKELQEIYDAYKDKGLTVLGFPCNQFGGQEPGSEQEIMEFCSMNYGVTFPMYAKVDVNGEKADPLFTYLAEQAPGLLGTKQIKWNFTKFLIDRQGNPIERFAPNTGPQKIVKDIENLL